MAEGRQFWSEQEFQRLLGDRNVVAHRASLGRTCAGFILSSLVAGEAEILSVAIAPGYRGRGYARPLLDTHLRWLAGIGARTVFLEVGETNAPACRLYRRAGFREVGRRRAIGRPRAAFPPHVRRRFGTGCRSAGARPKLTPRSI